MPAAIRPAATSSPPAPAWAGHRPGGPSAASECLRLGALEDLAELRLTQWAHMLGFRGHFSTRSRHYSTTLGDIRADRTEHAISDDITTGRLPLFEEDTVLVVSEWLPVISQTIPVSSRVSRMAALCLGCPEVTGRRLPPLFGGRRSTFPSPDGDEHSVGPRATARWSEGHDCRAWWRCRAGG
ncbi:replication initiator [Microtetraspora malaysiensis]|uniref:replication initiator n=1 Tax=Microtetraspora malaysiensis TaxID=161358 RepID=UPI003D8CFDD2